MAEYTAVTQEGALGFGYLISSFEEARNNPNVGAADGLL